MDIDAAVQDQEPARPLPQPPQMHTTLMVPLVDEPRNRRTTTDSFVSARENLTSRIATEEPVSQTEISEPEPMQIDKPETLPTEIVEQPAVNDVEMQDDDDLRSPSDGSSPIKPLFRKSSLNFASLPAREPLAKTSFGARNSQFEKKSFGSFNRPTIGPRVTGGLHGMATEPESLSIEQVEKPAALQEASEATKIASKTSTQRLADKISMLGQSSSRTSHLVSFEKTLYPQISQQTEKSYEPTEVPREPDTASNARAEYDDEDWIAPIKKAVVVPAPFSEISIAKNPSGSIKPVIENGAGQGTYGSPARPLLYKKMASTTVLESPTRAAMAPDPATRKPISVSNPTLAAAETTTPPASPPRSPSGRKMLDGPLSASKAKFYSVLKSAKGMFASSAGVSAHAKLEALSPGRVRKQVNDAAHSPTAEVHPRPALYPNVLSESKMMRSASPDGRRLRSSTELKRKEDDERHRAVDDLEKVRQRERQKAAEAAAQKMNRAPPPKSQISRPAAVSRVDTDISNDDDVPPPVPPKTMMPSSKIRDPRRVPVPKAAPKEAGSKVRPAPVTVRMPSQRIGHAAPSTATLGQSLHETLPPPPPPKPTTSKAPTLTKHANASTTSLKSTASAKRAMTAAAKKKEEDARLAQRKAEQKKDFEQKRAQRLEEERKLEQQRKAAEIPRVQEARKAAQRQAEEVKRKEAPRPESRQNAPVSFKRSNHSSLTRQTSALQNEKAAHQNHPRGDMAAARPVSRMNMVPESNRVAPTNPAKAPKRALPVDADEHGPQRSAAPRAQPSYQQLDAKRRKTDDEEPESQQHPQPQRPSVLAPPIRQSTVKKVCLLLNVMTRLTFCRIIASLLTCLHRHRINQCLSKPSLHNIKFSILPSRAK
jgi:hypothetical protein